MVEAVAALVDKDLFDQQLWWWRFYYFGAGFSTMIGTYPWWSFVGLRGLEAT